MLRGLVIILFWMVAYITLGKSLGVFTLQVIGEEDERVRRGSQLFCAATLERLKARNPLLR
jgi:hypothetical protein